MANGNGYRGEVKKHIIGLFVEDKPGVLGRLTGLFLRRGFNIDTIIVGKTNQPGISHIVISLFADDKTLEQIEKQAYKIVEVVKIINLEENSVIREHCLVKVSSSAKTRQDILTFAQLNKANVLEANQKSILIELVAIPEKIDQFIDALKPFGIKELSRTGINAMVRA
jgi:acetolactate synthase-1/3 small subunit